MHSPLSYDKWAKVDEGDSDEEGMAADGAAAPLLSKSQQQLEADEARYEKYKSIFKQHCKGQYPLAARKLLARFIAIQHRGTEPTNTYRYADIMGLVQQRRSELLERSSVELLCELHKRMLNAAPSNAKRNDPSSLDAELVLEAINTLEAIQEHPPISALFESLCNPSRSDHARSLYEEYAKKEFAKRAMMRYLFGDDSFAEMEDDMRREKQPGAAAAEHSECCGVDREVCMLLFSTVGCFLVILLLLLLLARHLYGMPGEPIGVMGTATDAAGEPRPEAQRVFSAHEDDL